MIAGMTMGRAHIALDLEVDGDQISGLADDGCGQPQPFLGWLGLIAALDHLVDRVRVPPDPADDEPLARP